MRNLNLILIMLTTALTACTPYGNTKEATVYIISVGLDYRDSSAPDLLGCPDDALEIGSCLSDMYRQRGINTNVSYLVQYSAEADKDAPDYPDADAIIEAIADIPSTEDDLIIFYYSGHGDVEDDGNTFLAVGSAEADYEKLAMDSVFDVLEAKDAPAIAIIDACYSGAMAISPDQSILDAFADMFGKLDLRSVKVIAASGSDELSYMIPVYAESGEQESHGALTASILGILDWKHTSFSSRGITISGCEKTIHGRTGYFNRSLTADGLFKEISDGWRYTEQTPITNLVPVAIKLIG